MNRDNFENGGSLNDGTGNIYSGMPEESDMLEITDEGDYVLKLFIRRLLDADGPTPQIRSNGADGIEVEWLVNGVSLTIDVASESEILIYAVDNAERELFSKEITSRWSTSDEIFDKAAALLKDMARNIDVPAPLLNAGIRMLERSTD